MTNRTDDLANQARNRALAEQRAGGGASTDHSKFDRDAPRSANDDQVGVRELLAPGPDEVDANLGTVTEQPAPPNPSPPPPSPAPADPTPETPPPPTQPPAEPAKS